MRSLPRRALPRPVRRALLTHPPKGPQSLEAPSRSLERRLRGSPSSPPCVEHQIFCRCGRRNRCCDLWPRRWHPSGMPMLLRIGFPAVSPSSTAGYRLKSLRDEGRQESMAQVASTRMPEASHQVAGGRAQRYHRLQIRRTRASRQGCQPSALCLAHSIPSSAPSLNPRGPDLSTLDAQPSTSSLFSDPFLKDDTGTVAAPRSFAGLRPKIGRTSCGQPQQNR